MSQNQSPLSPSTSSEIVQADPVMTALSERAPKVLAFFDPEILSKSLEASGWTAAEEISLLAGIATSPTEDLKLRLAAMKQIRQALKDSLAMAAPQTVKASRTTTTPDGTQITEDIEAIKNMGGSLARAAKFVDSRDVTPTKNRDPNV